MAEQKSPDQFITQSLVDRLITVKDAKPQSSRREAVNQLKRSLRRDLEWLLNTRRNPDAPGAELPETARSVFSYGLPDFTTMAVLNVRDRNAMQRALADCLSFFEPRLKNIRVTLRNDPDSVDRTLRFQIDGLLMMDPAPERISFDTVYMASRGEYQVKGDISA